MNTLTKITLLAALPLSLAAVAFADEAAQAVGNLLTDPADPANWKLEEHDDTKATLTQDGDTLHLTVETAGEEPWHVQTYQDGLELDNGTHYLITFDAKADAKRTVAVSVSQQTQPYDTLGLYEEIEIGTAYEPYELYFTAENARPGDSRGPVIAHGEEAGELWLRNVTLRVDE